MNEISRGIRNHNPGNLREAADGGECWDGERSTNDDLAFEEFDSPEYGIRALCRVLLVYYSKYNLNTVEKIINRYAPPSENDTTAYIDVVCRRLGVQHNTEIWVPRSGTMELLVRAIITHENGEQPYNDKTILDGIHLALR